MEDDEQINGMVEAMQVLSRRYDGSDESREIILKGIVALASDRKRDEDDIEEILFIGSHMANHDMIDARGFLEQLVVPLAHAIEDEEMLRNVTKTISGTLILFDDAGEVLGESPLDRNSFETLVMLFQKLSRMAPNGFRPHSPVLARNIADALYGKLSAYDKNDRTLLAMIQPFTTQGQKAAAHTHAAAAAPKYLN